MRLDYEKMIPTETIVATLGTLTGLALASDIPQKLYKKIKKNMERKRQLKNSKPPLSKCHKKSMIMKIF